MKVNKRHSFLSDQEKEHLRERIMKSANRVKFKKRNNRMLFSIAALVLILLSASTLFLNKPEPTIEDYVNKSPAVDIKQADGVTLILGEGSSLNLDGENSEITYSKSGENISVNSGKTVNQKSLIDDKPIFNTLIVPYGTRTNIQLSDGTTVWINSGSKLVYPAVFKGKFRSVFLEGEAIFDVSHNAKKPFKVISENQEIEVFGTVFNVSHYSEDDLMYTVLKSGSIQMTNKKDPKNKVRLTPGTMAYFNPQNSNVKTKQVIVSDYFSWKDGILNLKSNDLRYITDKLSRYYNVEITIENEILAKEKFSGKLDLRDNAKSVIENIQKAINFQVTQNKNKIIITN